MEDLSPPVTPESGPSGAAKRSLRSVLVRPKPQIKLALVMVSTGILFASLPMIWVNRQITIIVNEFESKYPDISLSVVNVSNSAMRLSIGYIAFMSIACTLIGVVIAHKIYGPVIPFLRHIENLKNGNYTSRMRLRKGDEFHEIADALNDLAVTLEKPKA